MRSPAPWKLTDKEVVALRLAGLDIAGALLFKPQRTEFEDVVVNALRLYARSSLEGETTDRVINILAALESLPVRDASEPIQQNLGERLAFYLADTANDRMRIVATLRGVYGGRSSFLHRGKVPGDNPELKNFLGDAWKLHVKVVRAASHFATKRDFINSIEAEKFA